MIIKGGFEMETAIIVGTVWISLLVVCLWLNYRFHRSYLTNNNNQEFILESPVAIESNDEWGRELKLSRGC
jgi:hypothetical protein